MKEGCSVGTGEGRSGGGEQQHILCSKYGVLQLRKTNHDTADY